MDEAQLILDQIQKLPLKDALSVLVIKGVVDFSKKGYARIKQAIQDKYNEHKFAFVPDVEEAKKLASLSGDAEYRQFLMFIPHYRFIDLIRTGLLIKKYNEHESDENKERIRKIKEHIVRRPNGRFLIKIANLPGTRFFDVVVDRLFELKRKNYTEKQLEDEFDEIVEDWECATMFVKTEDSVDTILKFCKMRITERKRWFFLLGMKGAKHKIDSAIAKMKQEKTMGSYEYRSITIGKSEDGEEVWPKTEIMFSLKQE